MKIKIEINTREHISKFGIHNKKFKIDNPWFTGETKIKTYLLEELLSTKLRALYQRKKGRDLFDLALALDTFPNLDKDKIIQGFIFYLAQENKKITRAQFEENFYAKIQDNAFLNDIKQLITPSIIHHKTDIKKAAQNIYETFIVKLPGNSWKSKKFIDILT